MSTLQEITGQKSIRASYRHLDDERIERMRVADREYQRNQRLLNPEKKQEANTRYRAKNAEKIKAHLIVRNAIKLGHLRRLPCEQCGGKAQAHHPDYSKPLYIHWLCASHHKLEHLIGREITKKVKPKK